MVMLRLSLKEAKVNNILIFASILFGRSDACMHNFNAIVGKSTDTVGISLLFSVRVQQACGMNKIHIKQCEFHYVIKIPLILAQLLKLRTAHIFISKKWNDHEAKTILANNEY